jgi:hypothetical protein
VLPESALLGTVDVSMRSCGGVLVCVRIRASRAPGTFMTGMAWPAHYTKVLDFYIGGLHSIDLEAMPLQVGLVGRVGRVGRVAAHTPLSVLVGGLQGHK